MSPALAELAVAHGIVLDYYDIWGRQHHATEHTLKAILGAMGIDAGSDERIADPLRAHAHEKISEVIPPATIVHEAEHPWHVRLTLPEGLECARITWQLTEESGQTHSGQFTALELPETDRAASEGRAYATRTWSIALRLPKGYHRVVLTVDERTLAEGSFIVVPKRSYWPEALAAHGRVFGIAAQLYAVRSTRNFGIGDFSDLTSLIEAFSPRGASIIGLNPLHALFPHNPAHASPYSPSSRLFRNWLYIDVTACDDFAECDSAKALVASAPFQVALQALRAAELVDYTGVASTKRQVLDLLYAHFRAHHLAQVTDRARAFREFRSQGGLPLHKHALFEALQEHLSRDCPRIWGWPAWPAEFHDPEG